VANKDERAYIDVLFFSSSGTSNSASSFSLADSDRRSGLRLRNTQRSETFRQPIGAQTTLPFPTILASFASYTPCECLPLCVLPLCVLSLGKLIIPSALSKRYTHDSPSHLVVRLQQYMRPHIPMVPLPEIPYRHENRQPTRYQARIIHTRCINRYRVRKAINHVKDNDVRARYARNNVSPCAGHPEWARLNVFTVEEDVR
jgi:hypothetical protein